jgi:hypothetical protein
MMAMKEPSIRKGAQAYVAARRTVGPPTYDVHRRDRQMASLRRFEPSGVRKERPFVDGLPKGSCPTLCSLFSLRPERKRYTNSG